MPTGTEQRLGNIDDKHSKTVMGRTIQGIHFKDDFDDDEQWNDAINTDIWTDNDSDANHITTVDSSNSRAEMDGNTSIGSCRITTKKQYGTFTVIKAKLTTTTLTPNAAGSIGAWIRIYKNDERYVKYGPFKDGGGAIDSICYTKFYDQNESSEQTHDFTSTTSTDAVPRWYKIVYTENQMHFYSREGDTGSWDYRGQIGIKGIDKFYVDLMVESEHASDTYVDCFWGVLQISTLDYDLAETINETVGEEKTAGTFGVLGGGYPVAEHNRKVFWVDADNGSDIYSGATAATAKATIDAAVGLGAQRRDDVVLVKAANNQYDENANTEGVDCDIYNLHIYGMGQNEVQVVNSNASATSVFGLAQRCEIAGISIFESTNTVEGMANSGTITDCYIHDCIFNNTMENGIHVASAVRNMIYNNTFVAITNDGIEISGSSNNNEIYENRFRDVGDNAIHLNGDSVDFNYVYNNIINGGMGTTDYAITITDGDENLVCGNTIGELGTWPIFDSGSNNSWVNNHADQATSNWNRTAAQTTTEVTTDAQNLDMWTSGLFEIRFDVNALDAASEGTLIDFYAYTKEDGTNYRKGEFTRFRQGTDTSVDVGFQVAIKGGDSKLQIGHQTSSSVTANRVIYMTITQVA